MKYFSKRYLYAQNLIYNYKYHCKKSGHKIIAVVKANAYGHGEKQITKILSPYCDFFATENLDEALVIRKMNKHVKILILGYCADYPCAGDNDIAITCDNLEQIKKIQQCDKKAKIHLKINTGMNRLGLKSLRQFTKILKYLKDNDKIILEGIFTHFFDTSSKEITYAQIDIFKKYLHILKKYNFNDIIIHVGGSGAINYDVDFVNYIRCGIALYGYFYPGMKPVQTIESQVIKITRVKRGEFVGYGQCKIKRNIKVAVIPLGYADGLPRHFEKLYVLYGKTKCPVVGKICMDMFMVDISHTKLKVGEFVKVFFDASLWAKGDYTEYNVLTALNNCRANTFIVVEK